jgi:YfiH family protein
MADAFWLDSNQEFHSRLLDGEAWLRHGFGTRQSSPPEGALATAKQIHSATVIDCSAPGLQGEGDALVTPVPGLAVAVKTADCLPVLLADPARRVVAAVHAGWRGTVQEIIPATIQRLSDTYQTDPSDILAAIGPGIGKCCFEVGPEVARQFEKWDASLRNTLSRINLDLVSLIRHQLSQAGVRTDNIAGAELCTMHKTDLFYSFRKEREAAGRMYSWIQMK